MNFRSFAAVPGWLSLVERQSGLRDETHNLESDGPRSRGLESRPRHHNRILDLERRIKFRADGGLFVAWFITLLTGTPNSCKRLGCES